MSARKTSRKGLVYSVFDRFGDLVVSAIRFSSVLGSRSARRIYLHRRTKNQRAAALSKKRDDWRARKRKRKEKSPVRSHRLRSLARLQIMRWNRFHRPSSLRQLLFLYLGAAAALSLVLTTVFLLSQTKSISPFLPSAAPSGPLDLGKLLAKTAHLLTDNRLDEAQKNLDVLNVMAPGNFTVLSHNGAMGILRKNYPAARAAYTRALEVKPDSYVTRYNLAEIEFLTKNYPEAERLFLQMHEINPQDEVILFRLVLCAVLQNQDSAAQLYLSKFSPAGRSPAGQYATAATLFQNKKNAAATKLLQQARAIFGKQTAFYDTTFREMGWIK